MMNQLKLNSVTGHVGLAAKNPEQVRALIVQNGNAYEEANANPPRIEVYQKTWCPYSRAALALLNEKGALYEDIDVTDDRVREIEMIERSGKRTVPQVFVDGNLVGGFDELEALDAHGRLDGLIGVGPAREGLRQVA